MPTPFRRCVYLDERGLQCETWFEALSDDKLCEAHREVISPSSRNGQNDDQKVRYIDLVNEERKYCYHFLDGTAQSQGQELIFQFADDQDGTVFEKLERHIAFLEKVLEDVKHRLHSARAVKVEKLEDLTEDQRKELRKIKVERAVNPSKVSNATPSMKKDPVGHLMKKQGLSQQDANDLLSMDEDALIAKYQKMKAEKEKNNVRG